MKEFGLTQSMSRKGNCHDNAVMENLFGRLKVEMFYGEEDTFRDDEDFERRLWEYIEWYSRSKIKGTYQFPFPIRMIPHMPIILSPEVSTTQRRKTDFTFQIQCLLI